MLRPALRARRSAPALLLAMVAAALTLLPGTGARAAEPACTISATLVNSCRPWLGAESGAYGASGFRNSMLEHEARIGRQLDIVHEYLGAGAVLTPDVVSLAQRPGTIALVNWALSPTWANAEGRSSTVNDQIDAMAASIKALGSTRIMLTVHHEPEDNISAGGDPNCPGTAFKGSSGSTADYVNMWHNVRARFDALGVKNVVWVMNYMGYKAWDCPVDDLWPGNDYVDWVLWDPYASASTWTSTVTVFYSFLTAHDSPSHAYLSKAWGLGEFGYNGTNQTAAVAMYGEARRDLQTGVFPRLKAYVVWDQHTSSSKDVRVGYTATGVKDANEQAHYDAFANDPLLVGDATPESTDTMAPAVDLTSPADAATVNGAVTVTGTAADDVGVTSTSLLVDGEVVSTAPGSGDGSATYTWASGTVPNGTHTLALRAADAAGNVGSSQPVTVTVQNVDDQVPTAPGGVAGAWTTPSHVTLTWTAATDDVAVNGYRVRRDGQVVAGLGAAATGWSDTSVADATGYAYDVTAVDAAGNESPAASTTVLTGDGTAPTAPTLTATATGPTGATLSWSAASDAVGVTAYQVSRDGAVVGTTDGAATGWTDSALRDGVAYGYRVRAVDAAGNLGDPSGVATVSTPDVSAPGVPAGLAAATGSQSVALSWQAAVDNVGIDHYAVYRDGVLRASVPATAMTWTDSGLTGTTAYAYRVSAVDRAGNESALSNQVVRATTDTTPPTAPTKLTGALSGFSVRLVWTAATDNVKVTGYTVYRNGVAVATTSTPAYVDPAAPLGRSSTWTVRATDAAGNLGPVSNAVSVTVPADKTAPTAPASLTAVAGSKQATLAWTAATDNVRVATYYLYRNGVRYLSLGNVTRFVDTGLSTGTKYGYKVYAVDASGNWSSPTSTVSVTSK